MGLMTAEDAAQSLRNDQKTMFVELLQALNRAESDQDWPRVESLCKQILQRDGDKFDIWQRLASSLEARSDWTQSETLWRHLTQRFSQRSEPYLALAALQRKRGAPDVARLVLEQAEQRLGRLSELESSLKMIDDPWSSTEALVSLNQDAPASAVADAMHRAQVHLEVGHNVEAEAVFEQLIAARPLAFYFQYSLANLKLRRGDFSGVTSQLLHLFQPSLRSPNLLERMELPLILLQALSQQDQWSVIEGVLPLFLNSAPKDARLLFLQARCALEFGRDVEALPILEQTLQLAPSMAVAQQALGELQMRLGEWDLAISSLERAVALQPDLETAALALDQARRQSLWIKGEFALSRADWPAAERAFRALLEFNGEQRALARLELLASLDPSELESPYQENSLSIGPVQLRLEQFSRMLDRLEGLLPAS